MATIELELDEPTLRRMRRLAELRHVTLEELVKEALGKIQPESLEEEPFWGMFADSTELMDEMVAESMEARACGPFRSG